MQTPWTRARKTKSQLQEERNGQMEGGKKQNNSGRIWRWKRDNQLHNFLIESRTTDNDSYSISRKEFLQIRREAFQTPPGLLAGMQIDICELQLIAIELGAFQDMAVHIMELEAQLQQYERELQRHRV